MGFSCLGDYGFTHRLLSGLFLWFIFRILQGNPKKELLRSLWVGLKKGLRIRVRGLGFSSLGGGGGGGAGGGGSQTDVSTGPVNSSAVDPQTRLLMVLLQVVCDTANLLL